MEFQRYLLEGEQSALRDRDEVGDLFQGQVEPVDLAGAGAVFSSVFF